MAEMHVSAVIPLYNGERYIEAALRSVLAQTLAPREIIVVDDGSIDDGPALVERLAREYPIKLLRKENGGQSSARNFGVRHATGDLIAFLDQDDVWYHDHLAQLVRPFSEARLGWAYSNLDRMDERGVVTAARFLDCLPGEHPKRSLERCIAGDLLILPSASLVSRDAFLAVGGFDERLLGFEDDDLFVRLLRTGYANAYIDRPLSAWREHKARSTYSSRFAESGVIYATKLLGVCSLVQRAFVARRFMGLALAAYRHALFTDRDTTAARRAAEQFRPHVSGRLRWFANAALLILRYPRIAKMAWHVWPLMRGVLSPNKPRP